MSRKKDKNRDRHVASVESVRRQLTKGNAREALKEAKLCFRREGSESHRLLLEEAFLARIQQLYRARQPDDAKAVLTDLLALGPASPGCQEQIVRLRVLLGDSSPTTNTALAADPSLLVEMVDRAVLDWTVAVPNYQDLKGHVNAVREALTAVENGEDSRALELLSVISRGSPLADWRLFVRGLSAFYDRDDERAEANWSRLDGKRPASRIARTLRLAARMSAGTVDSSAEATDIPIADGARRLLRNSTAGSLFTLLNQLSADWKRHNTKQFFRTYRQLHQKFARSHEKVLRQVVEVVWKWAARNDARRVIQDLMAVGPPPELDPCWNRALALQAEHPDSSSDLGDIESFWLAYVTDLKQMEFLSETDRNIAVGLIYQHLAEKFSHAAELLKNHGFDDDDLDDVEVDSGTDELLGRAVEYYRESIQALPELESCYLSLVKLYEQQGRIEAAAAVMQQLNENHPDNFDAACWLSSFYLSKDEPGKAAVHIGKAQRLRPRDPMIATLTWNQKLAMARGLVLNRQFEAARQELDNAIGFNSHDDLLTLALFRAGIELKAGNKEGAWEQIDSALAKVAEPAVIWMQMSSFAAIFRLARGVRKEFDERLSQEIAKDAASETAGRIARFLDRMRASQTSYVGRAGHERLFVNYLKRAVDISWQPDELKSVCRLLTYFPAHQRFRGKLLELGVDRFPGDPHFAFWAGKEVLNQERTEETESRLVELLTIAINSHQSGPVKLTQKEFEFAMQVLSAVKEMMEQRQQFNSFMAFDDDGEFDDDDEYDDDFDQDEDDGEGPVFHNPIALPEVRRLDERATGEEDFEDSDSEEFGLEAVIDIMQDSMPPEIRRQLERIAKSEGLTFGEAMARMVRGVMDIAKTSEAEDSSRNRRSPDRPGKNAKKRS